MDEIELPQAWKIRKQRSVHDLQGRPWFAWYPVKTTTAWRWLTIVRRCVDTAGPEKGVPYFRDI